MVKFDLEFREECFVKENFVFFNDDLKFELKSVNEIIKFVKFGYLSVISLESL